MRTDCGSYFVATSKRNRLTGGLNLKGKEEKKKKENKKELIKKKRIERKIENQVPLDRIH